MWLVLFADGFVGLFLVDSAINAEAAQEDEPFEGHLQLAQHPDEISRPVGVDTEEVFLMKTLRNASGMYHIVETVRSQLGFQFFFRVEVELDESDALVLQELATAALAYSRPYLHVSAQGFFDNKRADESACSSDEYRFHFLCEFGKNQG